MEINNLNELFDFLNDNEICSSYYGVCSIQLNFMPNKLESRIIKGMMKSRGYYRVEISKYEDGCIVGALG